MNKTMHLEEFYEFILNNKNVIDYECDAKSVKLPHYNMSINKLFFEVKRTKGEFSFSLETFNNHLILDFTEILSYWKRVNNTNRRLHYYDVNFGKMVLSQNNLEPEPLEKFFKYRLDRANKYLVLRHKREIDKNTEMILNNKKDEDLKPFNNYKL